MGPGISDPRILAPEGMRSRVTRKKVLTRHASGSLLQASHSFPLTLSHLPTQIDSRTSSKPTILATLILTNSTVTRSHKLNDRDHPTDGMMAPRENLPRYFAKSGPTDADPRKTKKDGGGKGNW